jgi:hypothetical protein
MVSVLVTCIYDKEYITGESDGGDKFTDMRWNRFYHSLASISHCMAPVVIYTSRDNVDYLHNFCNEKLAHKNFKVIGFELATLDFYSQIEELKHKNLEARPLANHYAQLVLSKPYLMMHAVGNGYFNGDKYFWVDAGLSFVSLMPNRYKTGSLYDWFGYNCFNPDFVKRLESYNEQKMFVTVLSNGRGSPYMVDEGIYKSLENIESWYVIGGLWGGTPTQLLEFYENYTAMLTKVIQFWKTNDKHDARAIFYEEPIFSAIVYNNPEKYSIQYFGTWYHEDDWSQVDNYVPTERSFYKVITGEP